MVDATSNLNFMIVKQNISQSLGIVTLGNLCCIWATPRRFGYFNVLCGCFRGVHARDGQNIFRRNISIGVPLYLSTMTEMGYIESLVENENSAKQRRKEILYYYNMLDLFWHI